MRILVILLACTALVLTYVLWPSNEARERRDEKLDVYRNETTDALAECKELVQYFDRLKPSAKKKKELGALTDEQAQLEKTARSLREDEEVSTATAVRGLEELEQTYWELMRNAQDLRARLREMKRMKDLMDPLMARNGRLQWHLSRLTAESTDPALPTRANQLFNECRAMRSLVQTGMIELSTSIVTGQTMCDAAMRQLETLNRDMLELLELHGVTPDLGGGPSDG